MTTPPQELMQQLNKLAEVFANLRRNRQQYVSPQQALPDLKLAHQCSHISRIFTAFESIDKGYLEQVLDKLESNYFDQERLELAAGLRAARQTFFRHVESCPMYTACA